MAKQQGIVITDEQREQIELYAELQDMDYDTALLTLLEQGLGEVKRDLRSFLRNRSK